MGESDSARPLQPVLCVVVREIGGMRDRTARRHADLRRGIRGGYDGVREKDRFVTIDDAESIAFRPHFKISSRVLLVLLGVAAACAYCTLMPMWEGYDEPFHYAIVQLVGIERTYAKPSRAWVSEELWQSRLLAPSSPVFNRDVPPIKTFSQFRALPPAQQQALRQSLERIEPALQYRAHPGPDNYESQQPPLTYALLAAPDRLLSRAPITTRALTLRLSIALFTVAVGIAGMLRLGAALEIPGPFLMPAVMLVLMTQTFLGAVCRVSNDWLGIALAPWLVTFAIRVLGKGGERESFGLGACLAVGMLAKANYLAFAPLAFAAMGIAVFKRRAASRSIIAFTAPLLTAVPWYLRNIVAFGSVTGWNPLARSNAPGALAVLFRVPWLTYIPRFARVALWNGNNHYLAFSRTTLDVLLLLLTAAAVLTAREMWRMKGRGNASVAAAACGLYAAALAYSVGELFVVHGTDYSVAPWYCPPLLIVLLPLLFWGLSRSGKPGRWIAAAILAVATYVFAATWLVKLIPLYAGFPESSVKLGRLTAWYLSSWHAAHVNLSMVTLGPAWAAYLLIGIALACAIGLFGRSLRELIGRQAG
jgi:hypothetical protein